MEASLTDSHGVKGAGVYQEAELMSVDSGQSEQMALGPALEQLRQQGLSCCQEHDALMVSPNQIQNQAVHPEVQQHQVSVSYLNGSSHGRCSRVQLEALQWPPAQNAAGTLAIHTRLTSCSVDAMDYVQTTEVNGYTTPKHRNGPQGVQQEPPLLSIPAMLQAAWTPSSDCPLTSELLQLGDQIKQLYPPSQMQVQGSHAILDEIVSSDEWPRILSDAIQSGPSAAWGNSASWN